ncbi:MAG: proliferating cell nuclear antigen (pcna) [Nanoarchaeota archaeon]|nr:proliferating cell nuclear antigen (pcna) [Nanoarchaeota archaeon]
MFKASLSNATLFKDAMSTISNLINEGTFKINREGIELIAMDPSNVSMIIFKFLSNVFDDYQLDKDTKMTINVDQLVQILRRAGATDRVIFELEEDKNRFIVRMKGSSNRTFSVPLIQEELKEQSVPSLDFKNQIQVETSIVREGVIDANMVSHCVVFEATPEKFVMHAKGDNNDSTLELVKGSPALHVLDVSEPVKAKYSLDYLDKITKAAKIADVLTIKFGTDYPLQMEYKALDKLQMTFILAPRVETE